MQLTEEQELWIEELAMGRPCWLSARAGTGKTSTILAGLESLDKRKEQGKCPAKMNPSMFTLIAFNKENQLELAKRVGNMTWQSGKPQVATLHSLGWAALKGYNRRLEIDSSKVFELMKLAGIKGKRRREKFSETMRLVSVAKNFGIGILLEDKPDSWVKLADKFCLYQADLDIAREVFWKSMKEAKENNAIDFDDMVYLPLAWNLGLGTRAGIIVDEAQDLSPLNLELIKKTPGKKWFVGDPFQCIYQFRGAGAEAGRQGWETLKKLPLTTCWRCGKEIIKEAQKFVPDIKANPDGETGEVILETRKIDWTKEKPACLLARSNEALVDIALRLWKVGRPVYILGRDFGTSLLDSLDDIKGEGVALGTAIMDWAEAKANAYPQNSGWFLALGRVLWLFWKQFKGRKQMEQNIGVFFSDAPKPGAWVLSTIHKAKGKEWDEVWLLDWETESGGEEWQVDVYRNLHYVAITRAKKVLHMVPENWWKEGGRDGELRGNKLEIIECVETD